MNSAILRKVNRVLDLGIAWLERQDPAVATNAPLDAIDQIVDYMWADEEHDYEERLREGDIEPGDRNHIFAQLQTVQAWLTEMERV